MCRGVGQRVGEASIETVPCLNLSTLKVVLNIQSSHGQPKHCSPIVKPLHGVVRWRTSS